MSMVDEQHKFLSDVAKLLAYATSFETIKVTAGEVFRTPEQQAIYVQQGKSKTNNSYHLKRLAIDLNFIKEGKVVYEGDEVTAIGKYWERLSPENQAGMFWTTFKDVPHFERHVL